MKKIFIFIFLLILTINLNATEIVRSDITEEEISTLEKLEVWEIVDSNSNYTKISINQPMSRIDVMSLTIKTYSEIDKQKLDKKDFEDFKIEILEKQDEINKNLKNSQKSLAKKIVYGKEDLYEIINSQNEIIEKNKNDIEVLKGQADMNVWLWLLVGVALIL